jgi:hypothetical protein
MAFAMLGSGFVGLQKDLPFDAATFAALAQITWVTACAFSIIGLNETIVFAVIGQGLHRPPTFFGIVRGVQGSWLRGSWPARLSSWWFSYVSSSA